MGKDYSPGFGCNAAPELSVDKVAEPTEGVSEGDSRGKNVGKEEPVLFMHSTVDD